MKLSSKMLKLKLNVIIGGLTIGALYFAYRKGRIDEIDEICNIASAHGDVNLTFRPYGKITKLFIQKV